MSNIFTSSTKRDVNIVICMIACVQALSRGSGAPGVGGGEGERACDRVP